MSKFDEFDEFGEEIVGKIDWVDLLQQVIASQDDIDREIVNLINEGKQVAYYSDTVH